MNRRIHPFTLLEVLIASLILCGMAAALFAFSSHVTSAWQQLLARKDKLSAVMKVDRAFNAILPNIIPFTWPDESDENRTELPILIATPNYLKCAYLHRLNDAEEGAIRFCEITVDNGQLVIQYSDRPCLNWNEAGNRIWTTVLADNVASLDFFYIDWDADITNDNWDERLLMVDFWDNENIDRDDVPLAILVTVTWQDGYSESWFRRTMGNGFRERFGKWNPVDEETATKRN